MANAPVTKKNANAKTAPIRLKPYSTLFPGELIQVFVFQMLFLLRKEERIDHSLAESRGRDDVARFLHQRKEEASKSTYRALYHPVLDLMPFSGRMAPSRII